ncbi:Dyp-type peroxidase [Nocardioides alcanivorans]|uniref:Dyp-type peroxidase n=1 Tax=Nocardioides alcanivorans TaxID=2897352 RepID=UPI001F2F7710|nr:Dyp-type peroxidase [Nocardioides alcanivorans]
MGAAHPRGTSRRRFLAAGGAGLATAALGAVVARELEPEPATPTAAQPAVPAEQIGRVDPHGVHQAGLHLPTRPPTHLYFHVFDAGAGLTVAHLQRTLATLGDDITSLTALDPRDPRLLTDPELLTVQIGIGERLLALTGVEVPLALPEFARSSAIPDRCRGGDLVIAVAADAPETTAQVSDAITGVLARAGFTPRWSQLTWRPKGEGMVTINPLGFDDGIVQPETTSGTPDHVFLTEGAAAGASVGVVRRFELDTAGFAELDVPEQEAIFGRVRATGAPLSGGAKFDDPNLLAKTPHGVYLIPTGSHVRAAHPSFTDSTVMLRRSYGFRESVDGRPDRSGLLFMSFQDDVEVFSRTQLRMDREDRLMDFATPTAEIAFLVLPGFDADRPLGSPLFTGRP